MCGITGAWLEQASPLQLRSSIKLMSHRGPDDQGEYIDHSTGVMLGHARLSIIDLSKSGHQPMHSKDSMVSMVYNGEIYNYKEIRSELVKRGVTFVGTSDTEVLLNYYLEYGEGIFEKLNGIFSISIYDKRNNTLTLARDSFGVKPLYYYSNNNAFAFSSEIKSLLPYIEGSTSLNHAAIQRYLTFLWCPGEGTPILKVNKLEPGCMMTVTADRKITIQKWYNPPQNKSSEKIIDKKTAILAVRKGLEVAVQRQLVSDVPVGAFLSGGLDSSAIVAIAKKHLSNIQCFTIQPTGGSDSGDTDDLPYAYKVAKHLDVPLEVVNINASQMIDNLEQMVWQLDEPLADPAPLNVLYISQLARSCGIKVLLSGAGGDDLFTGYSRHLALQYESLWSWLPTGIRQNMDELSRKLNHRTTLGRRLGRLFLGAGESGDTRLANYFTWIRQSDLNPLFSADMKAKLNNEKAIQPLLDYLNLLPPNLSRLEKMLALEQRFFLTDHNLNYTDKMSMAAGIEVRVPFLDKDLVNLAARLPGQYKQRGTIGKWVLKKAMESYLPKEVIYRPKAGFGAPLRRWMRFELREFLNDLLSEDSIKKRGLFEPKAIQQLLSDNDSGLREESYVLFSLMCIEIWCRRYID